MTKQTVVVLGASGFIGRRIIAALSATDWATPIAVSRNISSAELPSDVAKVALDATDEAALARIVASAGGVISCIAGSARDILNSGKALLQATARLTSPPRVVYLSSISAYGSAQGTVDEASPLLGDLGPYSAAKATIDRLAAEYPFVVRLRPGIVYGPGSTWWSDRIATLLVSGRLGDLGASGAGVCNLVHVGDVVSAALAALRVEQPESGAFNLGSPAPPTWNEYLRLYGKMLNVPPVRISRTRLSMELVAFGPILKGTELIFGQVGPVRAHPAMGPWLLRLFRHDIRMNVARAEERLGIHWRALDAGVQECAAWFLQKSHPVPSLPRR